MNNKFKIPHFTTFSFGMTNGYVHYSINYCHFDRSEASNN